MNENINLCELLKGHEGEPFYTPIVGDVKLKSVEMSDTREPCCVFFEPICGCGCLVSFTKEGKYRDVKGAECVIFPSKDQKDWNKWAEEQKPKVPKTWSELVKGNYTSYKLERNIVANDKYLGNYRTDIGQTPIEKSALALLKIYQLIEVSYGGNITNEEWEDDSIIKYTIRVNCTNIALDDTYKHNSFIAFHTREQRGKFLSYSENKQLVKDLYMI